MRFPETRWFIDIGVFCLSTAAFSWLMDKPVTLGGLVFVAVLCFVAAIIVAGIRRAKKERAA